MPKITVFLGQTDEEPLQRDKARLAELFGTLRRLFARKAVIIRVEEWDEALGATDEMRELIGSSDLCIFLFYRSYAPFVRAQFTCAYQALAARHDGHPKIFTWFREREEGVELTPELDEARQVLSDDLHHFYNRYLDIDTVLFQTLLQLEREEVGFAIPMVGTCLADFDGQVITGPGAKPLFDFSTTAAYKSDVRIRHAEQDIAALERRLDDLLEAVADDSSDDAIDQMEQVSQELSARKQELAQLQGDFVREMRQVAELLADSDHLSERRQKAIRAINLGRRSLADAILDLDLIEADARASMTEAAVQEAQAAVHLAQRDASLAAVRGNIGDIRFKVTNLLSMDKADTDMSVRRCYELALRLERENDLEPEATVEYGFYLLDAGRQTVAVKVLIAARDWYRAHDGEGAASAFLDAFARVLGGLRDGYLQMGDGHEELAGLAQEEQLDVLARLGALRSISGALRYAEEARCAWRLLLDTHRTDVAVEALRDATACLQAARVDEVDGPARLQAYAQTLAETGRMLVAARRFDEANEVMEQREELAQSGEYAREGFDFTQVRAGIYLDRAEGLARQGEAREASAQAEKALGLLRAAWAAAEGSAPTDEDTAAVRVALALSDALGHASYCALLSRDNARARVKHAVAEAARATFEDRCHERLALLNGLVQAYPTNRVADELMAVTAWLANQERPTEDGQSLRERLLEGHCQSVRVLVACEPTAAVTSALHSLLPLTLRLLVACRTADEAQRFAREVYEAACAWRGSAPADVTAAVVNVCLEARGALQRRTGDELGAWGTLNERALVLRESCGFDAVDGTIASTANVGELAHVLLALAALAAGARRAHEAHALATEAVQTLEAAVRSDGGYDESQGVCDDLELHQQLLEARLALSAACLTLDRMDGAQAQLALALGELKGVHAVEVGERASLWAVDGLERVGQQARQLGFAELVAELQDLRRSVLKDLAHEAPVAFRHVVVQSLGNSRMMTALSLARTEGSDHVADILALAQEAYHVPQDGSGTPDLDPDDLKAYATICCATAEHCADHRDFERAAKLCLLPESCYEAREQAGAEPFEVEDHAAYLRRAAVIMGRLRRFDQSRRLEHRALEVLHDAVSTDVLGGVTNAYLDQAHQEVERLARGQREQAFALCGEVLRLLASREFGADAHPSEDGHQQLCRELAYQVDVFGKRGLAAHAEALRWEAVEQLHWDYEHYHTRMAARLCLFGSIHRTIEWLRESGRHDEAVRLARRQVQTSRALYERDQSESVINWHCAALRDLGMCLREADRADEQREVVEEQLPVARRLYQVDPTTGHAKTYYHCTSILHAMLRGQEDEQAKLRRDLLLDEQIVLLGHLARRRAKYEYQLVKRLQSKYFRLIGDARLSELSAEVADLCRELVAHCDNLVRGGYRSPGGDRMSLEDRLNEALGFAALRVQLQAQCLRDAGNTAEASRLFDESHGYGDRLLSRTRAAYKEGVARHDPNLDKLVEDYVKALRRQRKARQADAQLDPQTQAPLDETSRHMLEQARALMDERVALLSEHCAQSTSVACWDLLVRACNSKAEECAEYGEAEGELLWRREACTRARAHVELALQDPSAKLFDAVRQLCEMREALEDSLRRAGRLDELVTELRAVTELLARLEGDERLSTGYLAQQRERALWSLALRLADLKSADARAEALAVLDEVVALLALAEDAELTPLSAEHRAEVLEAKAVLLAGTAEQERARVLERSVVQLRAEALALWPGDVEVVRCAAEGLLRLARREHRRDEHAQALAHLRAGRGICETACLPAVPLALHEVLPLLVRDERAEAHVCGDVHGVVRMDSRLLDVLRRVWEASAPDKAEAACLAYADELRKQADALRDGDHADVAFGLDDQRRSALRTMRAQAPSDAVERELADACKDLMNYALEQALTTDACAYAAEESAVYARLYERGVEGSALDYLAALGHQLTCEERLLDESAELTGVTATEERLLAQMLATNARRAHFAATVPAAEGEATKFAQRLAEASECFECYECAEDRAWCLDAALDVLQAGWETYPAEGVGEEYAIQLERRIAEMSERGLHERRHALCQRKLVLAEQLADRHIRNYGRFYVNQTKGDIALASLELGRPGALAALLEAIDGMHWVIDWNPAEESSKRLRVLADQLVVAADALRECGRAYQLGMVADAIGQEAEQWRKRSQGMPREDPPYPQGALWRAWSWTDPQLFLAWRRLARPSHLAYLAFVADHRRYDLTFLKVLPARVTAVEAGASKQEKVRRDLVDALRNAERALGELRTRAAALSDERRDALRCEALVLRVEVLDRHRLQVMEAESPEAREVFVREAATVRDALREEGFENASVNTDKLLVAVRAQHSDEYANVGQENLSLPEQQRIWKRMPADELVKALLQAMRQGDPQRALRMAEAKRRSMITYATTNRVAGNVSLGGFLMRVATAFEQQGFNWEAAHYAVEAVGAYERIVDHPANKRRAQTEQSLERAREQATRILQKAGVKYDLDLLKRLMS